MENYEKILIIQTQTQGPESLQVAVTFNNIGSVYHSKGDYDKALENYNKSLEIRIKLFGNESN